jgi:hypothetical protein
MKFDEIYLKLLEDFNIPPKVKHVQGYGPNVNFRGAQPRGFKGANTPGIAPDAGEQILIKLPKKKKK